MKKINLLLGLAASTLIAVQSANAIILEFSSVTDATVDFATDDSFAFTDAPSGYDFVITTPGSTANGLFGNIGGSFSIDDDLLLVSSVTSTLGSISIDDGFSNLFTADLVWDTIGQFGTAGALNLNGVLNLSSISYAGTNSDLVALAANPFGTATVSFQFVTAQSLATITANSESTSYSGSITSVPETGSTLALLGLGLAGLGTIARRRK